MGSVEAMVSVVADQLGHLDLVVLNASGGLELGASPDYAMQLNRDAQLRLTELVRPIMRPGSESSSLPATKPTSSANNECPKTTSPSL